MRRYKKTSLKQSNNHHESDATHVLSDGGNLKRLVFLAIAGALTACAAPVDEFDDMEVVEQQGNAISVNSWTSNVKIPDQASTLAPALVSFGGKLHMVHNGSSNIKNLWYTSFDGNGWTDNKKLSGHSSFSNPALAAYDGMLHMVYQKNGTRDLYMAVSYNGGSSWSGSKKAVPTKYLPIRFGPSLTVFEDNLYMAHCAPRTWEKDNWVRVDVWNGQRWAREADIRIGEGDAVCRGTAIAVIGNQLRVVYNLREDGQYPMGEAVWTPGQTATGERLPSKRSWTAPAMTVCNGYAHLVHTGNSSKKIYWSNEYDSPPSGWSHDVAIPNQLSHAGAGLGCYNGRAIMVHNGKSSNQLWWSSYQAPVFAAVLW